MASKHDGKKARANMWVTHQSLARAKGGRPHYQPKDRQRAPKPAAPAPAPEPAAEADAPPTSETGDAPKT